MSDSSSSVLSNNPTPEKSPKPPPPSSNDPQALDRYNRALNALIFTKRDMLINKFRSLIPQSDVRKELNKEEPEIIDTELQSKIYSKAVKKRDVNHKNKLILTLDAYEKNDIFLLDNATAIYAASSEPKQTYTYFDGVTDNNYDYYNNPILGNEGLGNHERNEILGLNYIIHGKYDKNLEESQIVFHPHHIIGIIKEPIELKASKASKSLKASKASKSSKASSKSVDDTETKLYNYWSAFIDTMWTMFKTKQQSQDGGNKPIDILYFKGTKKKIYNINGKPRVRYGKYANGKIRYIAINTYKKILSTQHRLP